MRRRAGKKVMLGREAAWIRAGRCDRVCLFQVGGETVDIISLHKSYISWSHLGTEDCSSMRNARRVADPATLDEFITFSEQNVQIVWLIHPTLILRSNKEPRTLVYTQWRTKERPAEFRLEWQWVCWMMSLISEGRALVSELGKTDRGETHLLILDSHHKIWK